jgi:DNA mismatch repair ATPase MutS
MKVEVVPRAYFEQETTEHILNVVKSVENHPSLSNIEGKYFALSSMAALIRYLEGKEREGLELFCISIKYVSPSDRMFIGYRTVRDLELIKGRDGKSTSLFSTIKNTKTKMGKEC